MAILHSIKKHNSICWIISSVLFISCAFQILADTSIDTNISQIGVTNQPYSDLINLPVKKAETILTLQGSNTIGQRLVPKLVFAYLNTIKAQSVIQIENKTAHEKAFQAYIPDLNQVVAIIIKAHGSSTAFEGFESNTIDIGMSSRAIKPQEKSNLLVLHGDLSLPGNEWVLGMDGLAIITNKNNPIKQLTLSELALIFSGKVTNWSYFSNLDMPIDVLARDEKSGTYDTFKSLVLNANELELTSTSKRFESNEILSEHVNNHIGAIGFVGMAYVQKNNVLAIAASKNSPYISPTKYFVNTEDYPLSRRLFLYKSGRDRDNPHVQNFLNFITSKKGQKTVENEGFVSQDIMIIPSEDSALMPIEYHNATQNLSRVSLNFRLAADVSQLDSKSHNDLDRLADFIKNRNITTINAIGFSANMSYDHNNRLNKKANIQRSLRLSYMIAFGLRERGIRNVQPIGLGNLVPLVSDSHATGIIKNSRVEIWIGD